MGLIADRVAAAGRGALPQAIAPMRSGWAVLGDRQHLRGYSLLLSDPIVSSLNDLHGDRRAQFLGDMAALGDAVLAVTRPAGAVRINYSIYGNLEPELHAHCFPRFREERDDVRTKPPWFYPEAEQLAAAFDPVRDRPLIEAIRAELRRAGAALA